MTAPTNSPPVGSFSSMGALQFWQPRARVSAATQGRRKYFGPGRWSDGRPKSADRRPLFLQPTPSDGARLSRVGCQSIRFQRIGDLPLRGERALGQPGHP
ncbi:hypothetical protein Adu01nite_73940 [Paractinoplanes durhamensis]|uniref:Uncharacterized protein n=1 Tax=Paractinoplanes durhamensis TaxID=113563 RepID=A0ABQ3Z935_9ACTN|nr:hypothetical protein Adu01nite_73940 [Actinoplanes durhamensis]